ncbi:MAG TPA: VWA domain-containing protein [Planctomycetota bacterium]|nr:VWA domain-containing protein [Planctomycetota bacterium]
MVAEGIGIAALVLAAIAEWLHRSRVRRVAPLAFGPSGRPRVWARLSPFLRIAAVAAAAWGLATLLVLPPKVFTTEIEETDDPRHVILVLDVSPSMKLKDAGVEGNKTRAQRVAELMESFFKRVHTGRIRWSVVAVHNGALPVVVDTRDLEVIRNILGDLPLYHAFDIGKTRLFDGIRLAAETARPWKLGSTAVLILTDGDTVPSVGMPDMPPSVADVVVVGVGDARVGKFIDGHLSRQDTLTLKQIATRLRGVYHDGNRKHLETETLRQLASMTFRDTAGDPTKREYALAAVAFGAGALALLPAALAWWGAGWRPGVRTDRAREKSERPEAEAARRKKEVTLHA